MPSIKWNKEIWDGAYHWPESGDEWSGNWGSTDGLWWGTLWPRIYRFLPVPTILEIAPGHGRLTQYLKEHCDELVLVDLSVSCINACKERFRNDRHISYFVNDGRSLDMIPNESVDFVFSFDSLVHVEAEVISEYLMQLKAKLKPNGVGFIHHSNILEYRSQLAAARLLPDWMRAPVCAGGLLPSPTTGRAESVSAQVFASGCKRAGLHVRAQEVINWAANAPAFLIDCLSTFSVQPGTCKVHRNRQFVREALLIRKARELYELQNARA